MMRVAKGLDVQVIVISLGSTDLEIERRQQVRRNHPPLTAASTHLTNL